VSPEAMIAWRKDYALSQEDVGRLLGWGDVTLGRYERGALQTESHNTQLAHLMAEGGIARALMDRPDALSEAKKSAVRTRLEAEFGIPTAREIRSLRLTSHKTANEMGRLVFASAAMWTAWETGVTFPDARAGRLLRILMRDPRPVEDAAVDPIQRRISRRNA
jgi:DNA-binding transcriptional regulator YiaG